MGVLERNEPFAPTFCPPLREDDLDTHQLFLLRLHLLIRQYSSTPSSTAPATDPMTAPTMAPDERPAVTSASQDGAGGEGGAPGGIDPPAGGVVIGKGGG